MAQSTKPFGLNFEEVTKQNTGNNSLKARYDYELGYSVVETNSGTIPFIEWDWLVFSGTGTATSTKSKGEAEDVDPNIERPEPRPGNTQTMTENREQTDRSPLNAYDSYE